MGDQEDEGMRMAQRLSTSPEPKRSKSGENSGVGEEFPVPEESPEAKNRRIQRELMAAAAEKRIAAAKSVAQMKPESVKDRKVPEKRVDKDATCSSTEIKNSEPAKDVKSNEVVVAKFGSPHTLSLKEAEELFLIIFGKDFSKDVLVQWCNQGISFSDDPETSMGLVQHEGGPCGVLAAIQAFVLKYLLFPTEDFDHAIPNTLFWIWIRVQGVSRIQLA